jgi:hypothetical protein
MSKNDESLRAIKSEVETIVLNLERLSEKLENLQKPEDGHVFKQNLHLISEVC